MNAIARAPRTVVFEKMLPTVKDQQALLNACGGNPEKYGNSQGYWDDLCLTNFLEAVCYRYIAYAVRRICQLIHLFPVVHSLCRRRMSR